MEQLVSWETIKIKISCSERINIKEYLPDYYKIKDYEGESFCKSIVVNINGKPEIIWKEESDTLLFYARELSKDVYNAVIVLLNVLIKRALQEEGKYILHASSVIAGDRIILLFGSSGSGKTATAMKLAESESVSFLSNGSAIVSFKDNLLKICGTYKPGIKIRKSTLKQYDEDLCNRIFGQKNGEKDFDNKQVLSPVQFGFRDGRSQDLKQYDKIEFYMIQLDSLNTELQHKTEYDYKLSMQLYEDLNREINGSEVYITINNEPVFVPSFDNKQLCINRIHFINFFMEHCFSGVLMGGLKELNTKILMG